MTNSNPPGLRDIAKDLVGPRVKEEMREGWVVVVLYRVPSLPFVWLFARLGISPVGVTLLSFALALTMPVQAGYLPLWMAPWMLALSGALFQVLDCADGTLARVTGRTSVLGADLDYLCGMAQWGILYVSLGVLADRVLETGAYFTAVGAVAAAVRFMARLIRDQVTSRLPAADPKPLKPLDWPVAFVAGLSGLIPFIALAGDHMGALIWVLVGYALLDVVDGLLPLKNPPYRDPE